MFRHPQQHSPSSTELILYSVSQLPMASIPDLAHLNMFCSTMVHMFMVLYCQGLLHKELLVFDIILRYLSNSALSVQVVEDIAFEL